MRFIAFSIVLSCAAVSAFAAAENNLSGGAGYGKSPTASDVRELAKEFLKNMPGQFTVDKEQKQTLGKYEVPVMRNGDWVLVDPPVALVDSFAARTKAKATLFVKAGDEFVRVSTSLNITPSLDGEGTILDHASGAYKNLIQGKRYTGKVTLFGKQFVADYDVIKEKGGKVIGAYLVAIPLTPASASQSK
jgi:methyl-accepting chemotaxis protein-2 (aspartate sensor receptor)